MIDFLPMNTKPSTPKVGVAVFIERNGKILLLLRKGSHREGVWALPGGHMELGESFFVTCQREIKEELDIDLDAVEQFGFVNNIFASEGLHYVTLYFKAKWDAFQEPTIMEPQKIQEIGWFYPNQLPPNIFSENFGEMAKQYADKQQQDEKSMCKELYWERG